MHMPAYQQPAALCSQQGRACAAMQLLAGMQLRGPGLDPGAALLAAKQCWLLACRHVYVDALIDIWIRFQTSEHAEIKTKSKLSGSHPIMLDQCDSMPYLPRIQALKEDIA